MPVSKSKGEIVRIILIGHYFTTTMDKNRRDTAYKM